MTQSPSLAVAGFAITVEVLRQPHPVSQSTGFSKLAADSAQCSADLLNLQDRRLLPQCFADIQTLSGKSFTLDAAANSITSAIILLGCFEHFLCLARQFSRPSCLFSRGVAFAVAGTPYAHVFASVTHPYQGHDMTSCCWLVVMDSERFASPIEGTLKIKKKKKWQRR